MMMMIITFEDVQNNRRLLNIGRPVSGHMMMVMMMMMTVMMMLMVMMLMMMMLMMMVTMMMIASNVDRPACVVPLILLPHLEKRSKERYLGSVQQ